MIKIEHAGDAVESEAVEMVLLHPEAQIRKQEMQHLVLAVVEALRIPLPVLPSGTRVEILIIGAVEHIDTLGGILRAV